MKEQNSNFHRMMKIIDDVFVTRSDPGQIQVDSSERKKLTTIHPSTLSELANEKGPVIWILLVPTTTDIMNDFLSGEISEKQLLERTKVPDTYDCIYLCSATTLPEYRGRGETRRLCVKAINEIRSKHPIKTLFVWPFTTEGERLAESIARECGLILLKKFGH